MGMRVRVLYRDSRAVLILIVAVWSGAIVVGCVSVPLMHDPPMADVETRSGRCFPAISLRRILFLRHRRMGMSAVPLV